MPSLYDSANEIVETLKSRRLQVARLSAELSQAEYDLHLAQAKIERGWIKKAGDEKNLAATVEGRARIFVLALDADEEYKALLKRRNALDLQLEEARAEVAYLREKLDITLAAMRAPAEGTT